MSGRDPWFDDEPEPTPDPRPIRRRRPGPLVWFLVVPVLAFILLTGFSQFWTERLWFQSVGYSGVFGTVMWTRIGLFLVFGALMALGVGGAMVLAYRARPFLRATSVEQASLERYREVVVPLRWLLLVGTALVIGGFAGASASGRWRSFLLWRHGEDFGYRDPFFGRDAGFYVFTLPWLHYVVDFVTAVAVISLLSAALVHYLFGGIHLQGRGDRMTSAATAQLSVILGVLVLAKAGDYYLDRFDTLTDSGSLVDGATYTDLHAGIPARNILIWIAVICALLLFVNAWRRSWRLPAIGIALLAASSIVLGLLWPAFMQEAQVNPSQRTKEREYIQANIDATRVAYDLEDVEETTYDGTADVQGKELQDEALTQGIRLVDPRLVSATFSQQQQERDYYSVPSVLDVDRYVIDGQERDLVLAVRDLNQDGIPEGGRSWENLHAVYTHGYGLIAAFGNQRGVDNQTQVTSGSDGVAWAEEKLPPEGQLTELAGKDGYRGQIYFSENAPSYSIVGKAPDGEDIELDLPQGADGETKSTYAGTAGVDVGSLQRRLMFAMKYGELNLLLSSVVHDDSRILYHRDPAEMVRRVAPWLTVDGDPFPAMVDGKVVWLLDGYTTSNMFPQAEKDSFESMTTDALGNDTSLTGVPTDEINYMRNAVKAVVDAYDGSVTLYAWDEEDPLLKAWTNAFPGTVRPKADIPGELLEHMRYPEDLFKVQRYQLAAYHVTEADAFFRKSDLWQVPSDPGDSDAQRLQPPYRLSVAMPDAEGRQGEQVFSLTSVYTQGKDLLSAFVAVNADASSPEYGKFEVLRLSGDEQVKGPGQISNTIQGDQSVKDLLFKYTNGARVSYGNLLTLPVGRGMMYVQPIYTERTGGEGNYPELQFVVVSFGDKVGIGTTLEAAIADILGEPAPTPSTGGGEQPTGTLDAAVERELNLARDAFEKAHERQEAGDTAGWAEALEEAEGHVQKAAQLAAQADAKP